MPLRTDIQALRGLAVLLVVLQHAGAGFIGAGFLGVDIFFVISGFLITGMLGRAITQKRFRFADFYFRRARRLLPAAYVTFLATAVAGYFLLDSVEWNDFTWQLAGAVTFTGNLVLLQQTGYFEGAAALKPLLHVWSLAVEEQYYLLLPAAMLLVPRRHWFVANGLVFAASLALCIFLTFTRPDAAFYLLPARAWELALGSFAALVVVREPGAKALVQRLFLPALVTVLAIPVWPLAMPGFVNIALVCTATMLIVLRHHEALQDRPIPNALAVVGDASYSLYLVHWPIFAFINNVYAGDPSFGSPGPWVLGAGVAVSLVSGFALYSYVELPMRRVEPRSPARWGLAAVGASALLAMLPLSISARDPGSGDAVPAVDYAWQRRDNVGFDEVCDGYQRLEYTFRCSSTRDPAMMVWGDSFAMHLVPGLAATTPSGVLQATKSACGPLPGLAQVYREYTVEFAKRCLTFNQSVLDYLAAHREISIVVLSSPFYPYFDPQRKMLRLVDGSPVEQLPDPSVALATLRDTVAMLRNMGKRVVVVAPPPSSGFDYSHCLERRARNRTLMGRFIDCDIPLAQYHHSKQQVLDFLAQVQQQADVKVLSFDGFLCTAHACTTELDGTMLYRDDGHLSYDGSIALATAMQLGRRVEEAAR